MVQHNIFNLVVSYRTVNSLHKILVLFIGYVSHERWLLWLPVGLASGIALYFSLPFEPPFVLIAAAPFLAFGCWLLRHARLVLGGLSLILVIVLGFNLAQVEAHLSTTPMIDYEYGPVQVTGRLIHTEAIKEGVRLRLENLSIVNWPADRLPVKVDINLKDRALDDVPPPGSMISLWTQVEPLSEPVIPGGEDGRRDGYFDQIGGMGWSSGSLNVVEENIEKLSWQDRPVVDLEKIRHHLIQRISAQLPLETSSLLIAGLKGGQATLSDSDREAMRGAGVEHLLSSSGVHAMAMALLIFFPLQAFLAFAASKTWRWNTSKIAAVISLAFAMIYRLLLAEGELEGLRVLLMAALAIYLVIKKSSADRLQFVMISAAVVLGLSPHSLLDPWFQIFFAALLCLVVTESYPFSQKINQVTGRGSSFLSFAKNKGRSALLVAGAVTPFVLYHFQDFSLYGFISNLIAIPLFGFLVMPCLAFAAAAMPFGLDAWFLEGANAGLWIIKGLADVISHLPSPTVFFPAMPVGLLLVAVLSGLWVLLLRQKWRYLGIPALLLVLIYPFYISRPDFVVASDGKEWAARLKDGRLVISNPDHDVLESLQWQRYFGHPDMVGIRELPDAEMQLRCDEVGCVYHQGKEILAMPIMDIAALEDCDRATIVVAPFVIKSCAASKIIDDQQLWHHGAQVIYFDSQNIRTIHVRPRRGVRPWSPGWKGNMEKGQDQLLFGLK